MSLPASAPHPASRPVLIALLVGAGLSLAPFLFLGLHAFPSADDYCLAVEARAGFWAMQAFFYAEWTGRYSAMFLQALLSQWDLAALYPWFSVATIAATALAMRVALLALFERGAISPLSGWAAAAVATAVFTGNLPSSTEAYFWMSSAVSYQWGLIVLLCWLALLARLLRETDVSWVGRGAALVLAALLAGFCEVMLPLVVATVAGLLVYRPDGPLSSRYVLLLCVVTGAAIGAALLAPGNGVRSATYPDIPSRHDIAFATVETLRQTGRFVATHLPTPAVWAGAFAAWWWAPAGAGRTLTRLSGRRSSLLVLVGMGLVYATLFPLYWEYGAVNYTGEGRTYNVTFLVFAVTLTVGLWGVLSGVESALVAPDGVLRRRLVDWAVAGVLVASMIGSPATLQAFRTTAEAPAYLAAQQTRERELTAPSNVGRHVRVRRLPVEARGLVWGDIQRDADHWINVCTAGYYGVASVSTHEGRRP